MEYRRRVVDNELDELMPGVAAIAIEGARAVGKTETASARATTEFRLDVPLKRVGRGAATACGVLTSVETERSQRPRPR